MLTTHIRGGAVTRAGTGFLVAMSDNRLPLDQGFLYLVTNKHVVEPVLRFPGDAQGQCSGIAIDTMEMTLNLKTPINGNRTDHINIPTDGWFFPKDSAIDLAVHPLTLDDKYQFMAVSTNSFLNPELWKQFAVTPGDKLLTIGFFRLYTGKHQFQPMIREGTLAMVPDDKMPSTICDFPTNVYLADVHVIPGNSGSPMFLGPRAFLGGMVTPADGSVPFLLLGVVSGYMYEDSDLTLRSTTDYEAVLHANSGIAIVVPAEQLYSLLSSPELQQLRDRALANFGARTPTSKF
jgi:hypothetical protein